MAQRQDANGGRRSDTVLVSRLQKLSRPILFLTISIALTGVYLAFTIPVAVFPSTNFPRIVVGVDNGVMPIDQMMVTITRPLEEAVNVVPGLLKVQSTTSRGSAELNLYFDWRVDMFQTLQLVDAAVARVQGELPPTAKIETHRLTFATFPIVGYSITSDNVPQDQLWELATYDIKPRINRLDGVSFVLVQGGRVPEFHVIPDPSKLLASGITITDILDSIRRTNLIDSPGLFESNHQLVLGLVSGQVHDPSELAQTVIKTTQAGVPVRIRDIARVERGDQPVYTIVTANGKPAVLVSINRQPESNTLAVAGEVHAQMAEIAKSLPPGIHIEPFYDQSIIVQESIGSVRDAVLLGLLLSSAILVLFLHDWGTSLVAGLVIPATLLFTFVALKIAGESFNLMTLGGLAAAVGLVIDDAIVMLENIVLHRDAGEGRLRAIQSALREMTVPLFYSTVTPVVVFLPLIAITGVTGSFFRALAITMTVSLFTSLLLAVTFTPTLSQYFVRRKSPDKEKEEESRGETDVAKLLAIEEAHLSGFFGRIVHFYERVMKRVLHHRWLLAAGCAAVVIGAYFCYNALGSDLLPKMDEGGFILDYFTPPGSSLVATDHILLNIEKIIRSTPEVASTSRRTGEQLGLAAVTEANQGDFAVKLKQDRSRGIEDIMAEIRSKIEKTEPAVAVEFIQVLQDMIGDLTNAPEPVVIKLFSPDGQLLNQTALRVADAIQKVPGVVDVLNGVDNTISGPAVTFHVDPFVASHAGFTPEEVATDAAAIVEGEPAATPVVVNDRAYTVRVRFPEQDRSSLERMESTLLTSSSGHAATLGSVAKITMDPGQTEIRRENMQRMVQVTARLEGVDLGRGVAAVQKAVSDLRLPASIRVEYGGTYQEQQKSFHDLLVVLVLALVFLFVVLLFEFRTFAAPTAILTSAVLSTFGGFFALLITGVTFNVASFMGMIMVIGIVAKNGILLLDAENRFRDLGFSAEDSLIQAGRRRLRPIVMTALAAVAGMFPLALALGAGSQMLQPLAITVIGGIVSSMVLSLVVTPAIHFYLGPKGTEESTLASP